MAEQTRQTSTPRNTSTEFAPETAGNSSELERERIRSSNDRDQQLEREGLESERNRGYDEAVQGRTQTGDDADELLDVDPDSAASDNDRDDTMEDI